MPNSDPLSRIHTLYHFTDRHNLTLIIQLGGLYPLATLIEMGIEVPAPGGNEWSREADTIKGLDHYVHLCFRNEHPMEFRARKEGRIGESIFLQVEPAVLEFKGVLFAPDVANKSGVECCTLDEAVQLMDFDILYTWNDWNNPEVQLRLQQAEKYEILVPDKIPSNLIRNLPDG